MPSTLEWFYIVYALATAAAITWACIVCRSPGGAVSLGTRARWLSVIIAAAALRLLFGVCITAPYSVDKYSYADFQTFFLSHLAPYSQFFFTYPQGAALLFKVTAWLPHRTAAWHWLTVCIDVANACLVLAIASRRFDAVRAWACAMLYAVLPFTVLESAVNAHIEVYVVFLVLLALLGLLARPAGAGAAIAAAGMLKGWPIALIPLVIAAVRSRAGRLWTAVAALAAIALCTVPFIGSGFALVRFWYTLLPVPGAGGMSNELKAAVFMQNSLRSAAADIAWLGGVTFAAEVALVLIVLVAIVDLAVGETGRTRFEWAPRFALVAAAVSLAVVGISLAAQPWLASQYAYSWWTPTAVAAIRGIACTLASLAAAAVAVWKCAGAPDAFAKFLRYAAAVAMLIVLIHANNFGWYVLPALVLVLLFENDALRWTLLLAMCAFYVSYPSTSFASVLSSRTVAVSGPASVQEKTAPRLRTNAGVARSVGDGVYVISAAGQRERFAIADYANGCADGAQVTAKAANALAPMQTNVVRRRAVFSLNGNRSVLRFGGECSPLRVRVAAAAADGAAVDTRGGRIATRFRKPGSGARWWLPYAYLTMPIHARVGRYSALTVDQQSNYDPTFGGGAIALSIWLDGKDARGRSVKDVPAVLGDRSGSRDYVIRNRYHFRNFATRMSQVDAVHVQMTLADKSARGAQLTIAAPTIVDEPQTPPGVWSIIAVAGVLLLFFTVWLAKAPA